MRPPPATSGSAVRSVTLHFTIAARAARRGRPAAIGGAGFLEWADADARRPVCAI